MIAERDASTGLPFPVAPPLPHIREFREEDAEEVARMWRESAPAWNGEGPGGGTLSTAARVAQDQRDMNTIATFVGWLPDPTDGRPRAVGYCSLYQQPTEEGTAYVGVLSAHPAWHGTGVGRDLLKAALDRTVALGYHRLDLHTWPGNMKAVPLYKKSGYFWVPDTSVKMENFLPAIFRLGPAQSFFRDADWYADYKRDLTPEEDRQKRGELDVFTYRWEREGRSLEVVVDRKAKSVIAVSTERYALSTEIDDPRLPIGGERTALWRVENRSGRPLPVTILAEGEDAVRCSFQTSSAVEKAAEWSASVTAAQPSAVVPPTRIGNRLLSTVVIDGEPVRLGLGTQVQQPVSVGLDRRRWLVPGVEQTAWLTATNALGESVRGRLIVAGDDGLALDRSERPFEIPAESATSWPLKVRAERAGEYHLRASAVVTVNGRELPTKVFEATLHVGEPGAVSAEWDDVRAVLASDNLLVEARLQAGSWRVSTDVKERASGRLLLGHDVSLGPPFFPSVVTSVAWAPRVERDSDGVTLVLSARPASLPGLTFERFLRLSPSGVIKVWFGASNAGEVERRLEVNVGTRAELEGVGAARLAAPLATGLTVDDANGWPDWGDPPERKPERYAESWMARFGEGKVAATIWQSSREVAAGWTQPGLKLDMGAIAPGESRQSAPVYLYAGPGDWRTARALWRRYVQPDAPARDPRPRLAHTARLARSAFAEGPAETRVVLDSERTRALSGPIAVEADGQAVAAGEVSGLKIGQPGELSVRLALPERAGAVPVRITFDHQRSTDRYETAAFRVATGGAVELTVERDPSAGSGQAGELEVLRLDNGHLSLKLVPSQLGRLIGASLGGTSQLHASYPASRLFVWFNPWYGGVTPTLHERDDDDWRGKLRHESFGWREESRRGVQGIEWRGITAFTEPKSKGLKGLRVGISYLTAPGSNLVAVVRRLENGSGARWEGRHGVDFWPAPAGQHQDVLLHYLRNGERTHKRVPGGMGTMTEQWVAVASDRDPAAPVVAIVAATPGLLIEAHDLGTEGVGVYASAEVDLAPGEAVEDVAYLVVASSLEQARLYRALGEVGELV
jgi:RimJ/RimL family protein N-acetyltransferase